MAFVDAHREDLGIEPICRELAIAPSSWHEHAARRADPGKRPGRARRDDELREQIRRAHAASFGLYGSRKIWHQLRREGVTVAKCTVERLMQAMGWQACGGAGRRSPPSATPKRHARSTGLTVSSVKRTRAQARCNTDLLRTRT